MDLQRLALDGIPFRAGGCVQFAVLGQRQMQRIEQRNYFVTRCNMRLVRPLAEGRLVEIVERG